MMTKIWKISLFFVFCVAISIMVNLPVALILKQVSLPNDVKIYGVKGQVTSGHIEVVYANNFPIHDINYEINLSCLLTLHVCYQINYLNGKANISFNPLTNSAVIEQFDVEYSMAELGPLMSQLLVKPTGEVNLTFSQISVDYTNVDQVKIGNIDGQVVWSNAGVEGEDINLGDYQLAVAREDSNYRFILTDRKAILNIDGTGRLKPNGEYLLNIKIQADLGLNNNIKSMLTLVAKKKGLNEYAIHRQGRLRPHLTNQLSFSDDI
jgi:hypothetical protein